MSVASDEVRQTVDNIDHGLPMMEEVEGESHEGSDSNYYMEGKNIDSLEDILEMDLKSLSPHELRFHSFISLEVAYLFYIWYSRFNGFAARKNKMLKNNKGEILQQTFVCYREGYRTEKGSSIGKRKRKAKNQTRCGCQAKFRVHIDINIGRWYVTVFDDDHNHELLDEKFFGMLLAHRKMTESDILQMNHMRKVGFGASAMYDSFASQSGGYEKVGFRKKDIYNQVSKQNRLNGNDAKATLEYLRVLAANDPLMFCRYTVDDEGRLQHLFWCDGISRMNYKVFGDVLAFDATYCKNKYLCPLVFFSGVNHHNKTIVFGCAIISNETEETYVWLLEQLTEAMEGKSPTSVITDGDIAMRNAISRVFPAAHHRLCAWHLLRNATTNIKIPAFTSEFRKCMLGDYEVAHFQRKWDHMVKKFGVEEHPWVVEMYDRRTMWSTAHIRGNFFAGFRTTSRCEGLHSRIRKFIHSRLNLCDVVQQLYRCLTLMRYQEVEDDFESSHGEPVLQTNLREIERSASKVFTREILDLFRPILERAALMYVTDFKETFSSCIYTIKRYMRVGMDWYVSFNQSMNEYKCSCQRMESFGLPCEHIIVVLVYSNIAELPDCVLLNRWMKSAKDNVIGYNNDCLNYWDSQRNGRYVSLTERHRILDTLASESLEDYNSEMERAMDVIQYLTMKKGVVNGESSTMQSGEDEMLRDPARVRSKGNCSHISLSGGKRLKRKTQCGYCKQPGHNRRSCPERVGPNGVEENVPESQTQVQDNSDTGNWFDADLSVA